jgi:threonine synthase
MVCAGCGALAHDPFAFRCSNASDHEIDHVLRRHLDPGEDRFLSDDRELSPFLRFRSLLHAYRLGLPDADFCALVRELDARVAAVDGHGFAVTPFARADALSDRLGFSESGGVWVKDETRNVSGSHKARHLFGVLVYLEACERLGLTSERHELAIASCGNAALAAAVVAAAGERPLRVFVPDDADPIVLTRLEALGARITSCSRDGLPGDPAYRRLLQALRSGALPFTCQGNLNGLAVEGGYTLGWELAASGVELDRVVVQVGGGALASAVAAGLREGGCTPRLDTVQTVGAWPLKRAFERARATGLDYAARHRSEFMWPWEDVPQSIAHGILDDETYDWLAVVEAMLATGGQALVASELLIAEANSLARKATGIDVDHTGSAGLAGLLQLRTHGEVDADERVAVLFTGVARTHPSTERTHDEELSRSGHPVAEGLRAG